MNKTTIEVEYQSRLLLPYLKHDLLYIYLQIIDSCFYLTFYKLIDIIN